MKTLLNFILIMAMVMPGCQMDDLVVPKNVENEVQIIELNTEPVENTLDYGNCVQIRTDHALVGNTEWIASDPSTGITQPQYHVTAYGEAWLNEKEIGRTFLTLVYDPLRKIYSGNLETDFSGMTMVHRFAGSVEDDFGTDADQAKNIAFVDQPETVRGYINEELRTLLLRDGALARVSLAPNDEGLLEIFITIIGDYCGVRTFGSRN